MIGNWENFFDPTGGATYGHTYSTATNAALILGGSAGGFNLVQKHILDPLKKLDIRNTKRALGSQIKRIANTPFIHPSTNPDDVIIGLRSGYKKQLAKMTKPIEARYAKLGKFWKTASWVFAAQTMMELGETMFTPGISTLSRQRDLNSFADETPLDSQGAYTQRQRALMAIHDSQMSIRNVIGNESIFLHK